MPCEKKCQGGWGNRWDNLCIAESLPPFKRRCVESEEVGVSLLTGAVQVSHPPRQIWGNLFESHTLRLESELSSVKKITPYRADFQKRRRWDSNPRTAFKAVTG